MYIIRIRYLPATNYKGSRLKVEAVGFPAKTWGYHSCEDSGESSPDIEAAKRYAKQVIAAHTIRTNENWHFQTVKIPGERASDCHIMAIRGD